ncbi:hypothetical protein QNH20_21495 [Neobacillus sp. WH10]|uniref:hypothetical protein n=1 Tax=Neobacillus sp. WH10 TaxID=3047873 RepID=UPI0024C10F1C|nr:hypothetical protein [Neobacillus sp. WH10]WHY76640.1 hypothetical protein QNH20_21495 [Neobacillus sp. WH10]
MLNSIQKLLEAFEKNNILYCHWKSNEHLKESLNGDTDLDMLFLPSQRLEIEEVLSKCGLKRFRAVHLMQYNAIEDYIGFDNQEGKIWHLHLHYKLTLGEKHLKGYTLPWNKDIINNRRYDAEHGIYISNPNDEYMLLLIRIALKLRWRDYGKRLADNDRQELQWLLDRIDIKQTVSNVEKLFGESVAGEFRKLIGKNIIYKNDLLQMQKKLRLVLKPFHSFDRFSSWITRSKREVFWLIGGISRRLGINSVKPSRRIAPSGGTVVTFLGCDGAGKSTTLNFIKKEFGKKIDVCQIYMGSGDGSSSLLRYPMKLVARKVGGKGLGASFTLNNNRQPGFKKKVKYFFYASAKAIWAVTLAFEKRKKLKQITKARNNGLLVLTDRYPQIETFGYNDGPLLFKWMESPNKLLRGIANWEFKIYETGYRNAPDVLIKLMVSPETAIQRKPEMTRTEIENKINTVISMNFALRIEAVNTETSIKSSCSEVMKIIWEEI